jgi:hypothetical protein
MIRPTPTALSRPYAAEYQRATGCVVRVAARDLAHQLVMGDYVSWLECELKKARARVAALESERPKEGTDGRNV